MWLVFSARFGSAPGWCAGSRSFQRCAPLSKVTGSIVMSWHSSGLHLFPCSCADGPMGTFSRNVGWCLITTPNKQLESRRESFSIDCVRGKIFNWLCKGFSLAIDYALDYALALAGCFGFRFIFFHFVSSLVSYISVHSIPLLFPFKSFDVLSFPNMIYLFICWLYPHITQALLFISPLLITWITLEMKGTKMNRTWDMNKKWIGNE